MWLQDSTVHGPGRDFQLLPVLAQRTPLFLSVLLGWCQPSESLCPTESPTGSEIGGR